MRLESAVSKRSLRASPSGRPPSLPESLYGRRVLAGRRERRASVIFDPAGVGLLLSHAGFQGRLLPKCSPPCRGAPRGPPGANEPPDSGSRAKGPRPMTAFHETRFHLLQDPRLSSASCPIRSSAPSRRGMPRGPTHLSASDSRTHRPDRSRTLRLPVREPTTPSDGRPYRRERRAARDQPHRRSGDSTRGARRHRLQESR